MKKNIKDSKTFIISRTDSIGDVVLTIPMAGIIKKYVPDAKIIFVGNKYTFPIISLSKHIDVVLEKEKLLSKSVLLKNYHADVIIHVSPDKQMSQWAKDAKIPYRIGTSHRWFHWLNANILVSFSRKKSDENESILNLKLLTPFLSNVSEIKLLDIKKYYGFGTREVIAKKEKFKLIIHPKSKGSGREWKMKYYIELIKLLPKDKFEIYITGTFSEKEKIIYETPEIFDFEHVTDMCGKFNLEDFVEFIKHSDGLLACSTGPLHIAAAMGIYAIGIYSSAPNMHPRRWGALGEHVKIFNKEQICYECSTAKECICINQITPIQILNYLQSLVSQ